MMRMQTTGNRPDKRAMRAWCAGLLAGLAASTAMVAGASSIYWSDGDGGSATITSAAWNDIQAALTSAGNNPPTPGMVKLSGDFVRTANDATVGALQITNANITLSGGWEATFTTQSGRSILNVNGANSANNRFRALTINATNVVVQNLVVTNGYLNTGTGAGILVDTNSLGVLLTNLVVSGNNCPISGSGGGGGGIRIGTNYSTYFSGTGPKPDGARLSDCQIVNNSAAGSGGGLLIQNAGSLTSPVIIERCTITDNLGLDGGSGWRGEIGGGLAVWDGDDAGNQSTPMASHLVVANSRILRNRSNQGSGIGLRAYCSAASIELFGCLIASNYWNSTSGRRTPQDGNALAAGSAEASFYSTAYLVSCTVADNTHPTQSAAASGIYASACAYGNFPRVFIINSVTKSNELGFTDQRRYAAGTGGHYTDFQNTCVKEGRYLELDSAEGNVTSTTFAAAITTVGNTTPGFRTLTSSGVLSQTMQQNQDADPTFKGLGTDPYQLSASSIAKDAALTKTHALGFSYVDVNLDGSYTPMVDIIVANAPPGWSSSNLVYTTDLLGSSRLIGSAMDCGAYEMKSLSYSSAAFYEAAANDGSISNSLTVTLQGDTFNATVGDDLKAAGKVTTNNVPAGLQVTVTNISSTQAVITLTGKATANTANDSIANLTINFLDTAFTGANAASIAGASRSDLQVNFFGAAGVPALSYSGTNFFESAVNNDGSISNAFTVTLTNDTFTAGGPFATVANYPANLSPLVTRVNAQAVTIGFSGNALLQRAANNLTNVAVTFLDSAFSSSPAATVSNYTRPDLQMIFLDPVLTYSTNVFSEAAAYDGSIGNTLAITLAGDNFNATNNENLVASSKVQVSNVPAGLTAVVTRTSAQTATATLTGNAAPHNAANSATNLTFAFQNSAFAYGAAAAVTNAVKSDLTVSFLDPTLTYSGTNFTERWQNDGGIGNTLTITLAYDLFNGAAGQDLVALSRVTPANVPGGLTASVTILNSTQVVAALNGNATSHAAANNIANLGLTFLNSAFLGGVAAAVTNASGVNLAVTFLSQNPADWYVSTIGNDTNSGTAAAQSFRTLAKAVSSAQSTANDVIHMAAGAYTESNINVNAKVLTITGNTSTDTILQAAPTPFTAGAGILTGFSSGGNIRNLTLRYGNAGSGYGSSGAVSLGGVDTYFDNCVFATNACGTDGGAIWGTGAATYTFRNCQFAGNRATGNGGAIYVVSPNVIASNCTFQANLSGGSGGAILRGNSSVGKITVYDSWVSGNAATNHGGAIWGSRDTAVTIWNSTLSSNRAVLGCGGAIDVSMNDGSVTCMVVNSTITMNSAGGGSEDGAAGGGGAIRLWTQGDRKVILYNSTVFANTSATNGGGLHMQGYGGANNYGLYSSIVASNTAGVAGPDIYAQTGLSGVMTNSLLGNNLNAGSGGATNGSLIGTSGAPINPQLLPLADNGGGRPTYALSATSPAINSGTNLLGLTYDGRDASFARVVGAQCDMGAYEWGNGVLTYSTNAFNENMPANDGTINTNTPLIITLNNDASFASGVDFVNESKLVVSNLPAGLTAVATRISSTNLSVILTGAKAPPNNVSNSVYNLTFIFQTNAFTTGTLADNPTNAALQVLFQNNFVTADNDGGATNLSAGVAGLRGTVHNGQGSTVFVGWGPVDGGTNQTWANTNTQYGVSDETVFTNTVSSLLYGVQYYYTCWATNQYSAGAAPASTNFTTLRPGGAAIGLTNTAATGLTATSAVLNATLSCSGAAYNALVYWGTNNAGTNAAAWLNSASVGGYTNLAAASLTYTVTGLAPNVTNYYTFRATNALDSVWDTNVLNVRTYILSADNAGGATNFSAGSAGLRGTVYNGLSSTIFVGWGPVDGSTNRTWANTNTLSGVSDGAVFTNTVNGLFYGLTYYYCCWATNLYSTASAPASTNFTTLRPGGTAISLTNLTATGLTANSAILNAALGCSGAAYNTLVYWGTNNAGTNATAWINSATLGWYTNLVSTNLSYTATGLAPNTTNYFTFRATNALDSVWATNVLGVRTFIVSVDNAGGATNISTGVTGLRGTVYNGQTSTVFVGWGPADGGTNKTWANTNTLSGVSDGAVFTSTVSNLLYGVPYYYCCWATNLYSAASAPASTNFIAQRPTNAMAIFLTNAPASSVTATAVVLNASMACSGSVYNVFVYWNTVNGQTNAAAWGTPHALGWYTNLAAGTLLTYTATGLTPSTTNYFTFLATNAAETLWATNVLSFQTPVGTPTLSNLPPTNVTTTTATMNGYLAVTYGAATLSVLYLSLIHI